MQLTAGNADAKNHPRRIGPGAREGSFVRGAAGKNASVGQKAARKQTPTPTRKTTTTRAQTAHPIRPHLQPTPRLGLDGLLRPALFAVEEDNIVPAVFLQLHHAGSERGAQRMPGLQGAAVDEVDGVVDLLVA